MRVLPAAICLLALLTLPTWAQAPKPPTAAPPKMTLAAALAKAAPPADGLRLTVSAEQVALPDNAAPPDAGAGISDIAAAFGDQIVTFGTITAVAPSAMTLLNTQPDAPNLALDMSSYTVQKMLAASLDDAQWSALTSEHGLGLQDLSDDTQRGLFRALFNHGHLWIGSSDPAVRSLPDEKRTDVVDVTNQIDATRIRLGQTAKFYLHDKAGKPIFHTLDRPDAARRLRPWRPKTLPSPVENGVALKADVPNTLKLSDLDYDRQALQAPVSLAGLTTVGGLVTRLGQKTGLELYSDPRYAARTLTVQGAAAAPASDLLRALCVCVTGTLRKVGPAYVLTDDLVGVGVRRSRLSLWEDAAAHASSILQDQAGATMLARRAATARKLPALGDPLAVSPEEMAALRDDTSMPGVPESFGSPIPIASLAPAHQAWLREAAADYAEKQRDDSQGERGREVDLTSKVDLKIYYRWQLLVPSQSVPIDLSESPLALLYYPGEDASMQTSQTTIAADTAKALAKLPPPPLLSAALHSGRVRAVLAHPRTAKEVDALIASMQALGLNQLWLDVFSGGVSHVGAGEAHGTDIMTEALVRTSGTGIAVYADLSLLAWGDAPPEAVQDLTIDGLSTRDAALQMRKVNPTTDYDYSTGKPVPFVVPPVLVSPTAPAVHAALTALVSSLAARPGLAGFVWKDAGPNGGLGYTPGMRLAFLRSAHADPWDISDGDSSQAMIRTHLPLFDDAAIDKLLAERWDTAGTQADRDLLGPLRAAAVRLSGQPLPVLMEQEAFSSHWLSSWDDPRQDAPPLREVNPDGNYIPEDKIVRIARTQGRLVVRREAVENDGDTAALARQLQADLKTPLGDGFVLDFAHDEVTQGAAPLALLVAAVESEKPAAGSAKPAQKAVH